MGLPGIESQLDSIQFKGKLNEKGYIDPESFNTDYNLDSRINIPREYSPNEGVVSREKIVSITGDRLYEYLLTVETVKAISDTHGVLNIDYSKDALFTQVLFLRFNATQYDQIIAYFEEVEAAMLEPKVKAVLRKYFIELVGEFTVHESLKVEIVRS